MHLQCENLDIQGGASPPIERSLAGVITQFGPTYEARTGFRFTLEQRKAMTAIVRCRTAALGGHVVECKDCRGQAYAFHSCRHRACPRCMRDDVEEWLQQRQAELLPVPYFHIIFKVPQKLHKLFRGHKREFYPLLATASAKAIQRVADDTRYLGATTGVMAVVHTSGANLAYHPHVHCLMPSGGLDDEGKWRPTKHPGFAPETLLSRAFKDTLLASMRPVAKQLKLQLPPKCRNGWSVHVEVPVHGVDKVLRYLASSVLRGPLHKHQILDVTSTHVTFNYPDPHLKDRRVMTLEGHEFLRRFLLHVWPEKLHQVRYFGLWSRKSAARLKALRQQLLPTTTTTTAPQHPIQPADETEKNTEPHWHKCPRCAGLRVVIARFERGTTPPLLTRPLPPGAYPPRPPQPQL